MSTETVTPEQMAKALETQAKWVLSLLGVELTAKMGLNPWLPRLPAMRAPWSRSEWVASQDEIGSHHDREYNIPPFGLSLLTAPGLLSFLSTRDSSHRQNSPAIKHFKYRASWAAVS